MFSYTQTQHTTQTSPFKYVGVFTIIFLITTTSVWLGGLVISNRIVFCHPREQTLLVTRELNT